jgi:hypothetical protein
MSQKSVTKNIDEILEAFETEGGYNLLDPNNAESGYYANESGVLVEKSSSNHLRTVTPIPVESGSTLYIKTNIESTENISILKLDENGAVVGQESFNYTKAFTNARISPISNKVTAVHIWASGVNSGLSFNNICVSKVETTEYEEYGAVKTPVAVKLEMLPVDEIKNAIAEEQDNNGFERDTTEFAGVELLAGTTTTAGSIWDSGGKLVSTSSTTPYTAINELLDVTPND